MSLFWLLTIETLLGAVLVSLTFLFFLYFRKLPEKSLPESELPFISVIVPARNEEGKIGRCIESLARQDYPRFEIVAVDDRSQDKTGAILQELSAKYANLKCIRGTEAPPGWIGKCNALVQASKHVSGQWYLFTDADTCHTPTSLRYAISYAISNKAELISFMPVQELGSFWERAVMPVLLGSFLCGDPLNTINEHTNERAYAYGQYILVRKDVYEHVGGHESVHGQILDDISFARVVKAHGHHILSADGRLLYRVRMYTDLKSLWHGWTKNLYALIECNPIYLVLVILLLNSAIFAPYVSAGIVVSRFLQQDSGAPALAAIAAVQFALLFSWYRRCAEHYIGIDWRDFFLLPCGSLTVTLLYLHSAYLVHSGQQVTWKGRHYTVTTAKTIAGEQGDSLNVSASASGKRDPAPVLADSE